MATTAETLPQRFWNKVRKGSDTACWTWTGAMFAGRGVVGTNGKTEPAHRVAWQLTYGPIAKGRWVLHSCDTAACVNPAHLFLGDRGAVAKEKERRGTQPRVLTPDEVLAIRKRCADGELQSALATEYGVHYSLVSLIVNRKRWTNLKEP